MSILATGSNTYVESYDDQQVKYIYGGPIEVETESEMDILLTSENVGTVYKYVGVNGKYINGELYIIMEE